MKKIVLGVCGSSAIHKSIELINLLKMEGFIVSVVMTDSAQKFITPMFFEAVANGYKEKDLNIKHVQVASDADAFLIAPATANTIGELAHGLASNELTTTALLMEDVPKFIAPAMNKRMLYNKMVQKNLDTLKDYGYKVIGPQEGTLSSGEHGAGVLEDIHEIVKIMVKDLLNK